MKKKLLPSNKQHDFRHRESADSFWVTKEKSEREEFNICHCCLLSLKIDEGSCYQGYKLNEKPSEYGLFWDNLLSATGDSYNRSPTQCKKEQENSCEDSFLIKGGCFLFDINRLLWAQKKRKMAFNLHSSHLCNLIIQWVSFQNHSIYFSFNSYFNQFILKSSWCESLTSAESFEDL